MKSFIAIFFGLILAIILVLPLRGYVRHLRRKKIYAKPFPEDYIQILKNNVSIYSLLPNGLKKELHGRINIFLDEKEFVGCGGLEISPEIRLTIAGNACLLLLKRKREGFPGFSSIMVYPDTYVAKQIVSDGFVQVHEKSTRAGESWYRGPVVLSWVDVLRGSLNPDDGHNVVLHEFAHKLDEQKQRLNGLPILRDRSHYAEWAEVLGKEYQSFLIRVERETNSVIDGYGSVSPVEFFAVATESFFEKPVLMKDKLPALYRQFQQFYGVDPAAWS